MDQYFKTLSKLYKSELLEQIVPFWIDHSLDHQHGGYFTCLDRWGKVYDTDKFIWLQARQVWLFSMLYAEVEKKQKYLDVAIQGAAFLSKHGYDGNFDWYFSLTKEGKPLTQPYNIFSNTFAAMAFGRLGLLLENDTYLHIARKTFERILERADNPKGKYSKIYPGTRNLKGFSLPMILCSLSLEIAPILSETTVTQIQDQEIEEMMTHFYDENRGLILENITQEHQFSDTYEGRLLNPGHTIEAMWFIMDLAHKQANSQLMQKAVKITLDTLEYSWDKTHSGIFYFMDILGKPLQQLEWDQKLWWVHLETLISLLKGYQHTQNEACLTWFQKVHDYTWDHFRDREYGGEWFGYLNRRGQVLLPLKGGKWKGCFHVPRALYQCWKSMEETANRKESKV